jgi:hypothetical protein
MLGLDALAVVIAAAIAAVPVRGDGHRHEGEIEQEQPAGASDQRQASPPARYGIVWVAIHASSP